MTKATIKRCLQGNKQKQQDSNLEGIQIPTYLASQSLSWATNEGATYRCFQDHWFSPICHAKLNHWIQAPAINGFKVRQWIWHRGCHTCWSLKLDDDSVHLCRWQWWTRASSRPKPGIEHPCTPFSCSAEWQIPHVNVRVPHGQTEVKAHQHHPKELKMENQVIGGGSGRSNFWHPLNRGPRYTCWCNDQRGRECDCDGTELELERDNLFLEEATSPPCTHSQA